MTPSPTGRSKRIGLTLIIVGALAFVACAVTIGVRVGPPLAKGITGRAYSTPMDQFVTLTHGKWVIFQRTGTQSGGGGITYSNQGPVTISPSDVEVTDPAGNPLPTSRMTANETIDRNGTVYTGALSFEVPARGQYRVVITQASDQVLLSRDLGSLFLSVLWLILVAVASVFVVGAGVIAMIVRASRRRRRPPSGPPPGFYPHPAIPGRMLWWDGYQWARS
jgi:hypothetical protein